MSSQGAAIEQGAIAAGDTAFGGDPGGDQVQVADQGLVFGGGLGEGGEVFPRDHQEMRGGLRIQVLESGGQLILIHKARWDLARQNFTKEAV